MLPLLWTVLIALGLGAALLAWRLNASREALIALARRHDGELAQERARHREEIKALKEEHERARERLERDATRRLERAPLGLAADLLDPIDTLELALQHAERAPLKLSQDDLLAALRTVHQGALGALKRHDITPIRPEPAHTPFDPALHEAIGLVKDDTLPPHAVASLMRIGWHHPAKILRPAMVQTAAPTSEATPDEKRPSDASSDLSDSAPLEESQDVVLDFESAIAQAEDDEETQPEEREQPLQRPR